MVDGIFGGGVDGMVDVTFAVRVLVGVRVLMD